jgi:TIR domain
MKVFISWSGQTSKNIAEIFRQWLPTVIQIAIPYYSPDDITKGTRWNSEISLELNESKIGIICLTKDNLESPWIMFEAGALSKNIDNSKVCPILFGLEPTDIQGPLVQFQAARFNKEEIKKVVRMINAEGGDNALNSETFEQVFEVWWPKLSERIELELKNINHHASKSVRKERDILEEILSLTRTISLSSENAFDRDNYISANVLEDIISSWDELTMGILYGKNQKIFEHLYKLRAPIKYLLEQVDLSRSKKRNYQERIEQILFRIESNKNIEFVDGKRTGPIILGKINLPSRRGLHSLAMSVGMRPRRQKAAKREV